ncbi:hypothetical protein KUCAC02_013136 [Chaenocephalus aceratus]|uniref:Uncharacterized protein n=1 Tax=Chaenocephalus aceratus TaxID=36190 RepID=A0ACB9XDU3_CHAAC|nr:hypothetical protein KUCAC02_013136 [Chaenocephalus aceratus]
MEVSHTLICFFFLFSLQDGSTGLVSAQLSVYSGIEGETIRFQCSFPSYGGRKLFCKEPCEQVDILIETSGASAQSGRYSIDYKQRELFVSITQLTKSDSGKYWCGAGAYENIEIIVVDAKLVRFRLIVTDALTTSTPPSSVHQPQQKHQTKVKAPQSSPASPKTTEQSESTTTTGVVLYGRLTLVVLVIVSSLKRTCKAKKPRVETQNASARRLKTTRVNPAYSEIKFVNVGSSHSGFTVTLTSSDEPPLYSTVNDPQ